MDHFQWAAIGVLPKVSGIVRRIAMHGQYWRYVGGITVRHCSATDSASEIFIEMLAEVFELKFFLLSSLIEMFVNMNRVLI